jgi:hypothetical protein
VKKFSVFLAILFCSLCLSLVFVSCDDGSTGGSGSSSGGGGDGTLTITDIPAEYNGKYAVCSGTSFSLMQTIQGFETYNSSSTRTLPQISNGRVSIKLWYVSNPISGTYPDMRYSETETIPEGQYMILIEENPIHTTQGYLGDNISLAQIVVGNDIAFSKGNATISCTKDNVRIQDLTQ